MKTRCVIVEDHVMFVDLLSSMLCLVPGLKVVGKARSAKEGIDACYKHRPDLLILDLTLPDQRGTAVARELLKINPAASILILSGEASTFVCPAALRKNIKGVVDKTQTFDALRQSWRRFPSAMPFYCIIHSGYLTTDFADELMGDRRKEVA